MDRAALPPRVCPSLTPAVVAEELDLNFDFLSATEAAPLPVHVVEARRAERRRWRANVPRDTTPREFAELLGLGREDTSAPAGGGHTQVGDLGDLIEVEAARAYEGDPEDVAEAYRALRRCLIRPAASDAWLKGHSFLGSDVTADYTRLKRFEDDAMRLLDANDADSAIALEEKVLREGHSEAHRECVRKYREQHCPQQVALHLSLERCRRATGTPPPLPPPPTIISTPTTAISTSQQPPMNDEIDNISIDLVTLAAPPPPPQRQWKGKNYKQEFLKSSKES